MIGAIIGDIAGSRFEWENHRSKDFNLFDDYCHPTDDSIMSLAVAKAILESEKEKDDLSANAISCMQELGRIYDNAGYGGRFIKWIWSDNPEPYNSFGNGAAMRVGPCGFAATSIEEAKELSAAVTRISHNHPQGMKGAEAIAAAIFLARSGKDKGEIKKYLEENYYGVNFKIDDIRKTYKFDVSCQGSVPVALEAFFEAANFEDAIRTAISVGGDSDTIACMAGAVAEAYFGVPEEIIDHCADYLDRREMEILYHFEKRFPSKCTDQKHGSETVFDALDYAVNKAVPSDAAMHTGDQPPAESGKTGASFR